MKKVFLFIPLLALVGCAPQIAKNGTTTSVSYQQNGTNCVYTEKFGDVFFVSERKGFSKKEKKEWKRLSYTAKQRYIRQAERQLKRQKKRNGIAKTEPSSVQEKEKQAAKDYTSIKVCIENLDNVDNQEIIEL